MITNLSQLGLYQSYSGAKIRFYFLIINHLISFPNECKNIVKKYVQQLELYKNKPRITYPFTVACIFLLLAFYHNIFCFFTTDLQSDAIFVFAAGQKTISAGQDISFLCHSVYHPDKGASM